MNSKKVFLQLVRLGIGHCADTNYAKIDWDDIRALAEQQGLYAVVLDGVGKLPANQRPPQVLLLEWIGEVLQNYENRYNEYTRAIAEMAGWHNANGYKMMVLKGYACSLDWPRPEHRPCGDIDIWQFGKQKEADAALTAWFKSSNDSKVKGFKIDNSHHHHSVFSWGGFMVENHYDFVNVHHHKSHARMEQLLKELGQDDSHSVRVNGEKVYIPSPNLHALFLLKHTMLHFVSGEISIRQLLDWGFFIEKHGEQVVWDEMLHIFDKFHMRVFFNIINAICVEELGFNAALFPEVQFNPILKERVLKDIMFSEYRGEIPENFIARIIWKLRRWKANEWKHELCYKESMWSAFWSGVWSHLLKPSSI